MENENFAAPKPNEPLMSQNNQGQHHHHAKSPIVAVVEEDESKKKFLPPIDGEGAHYKKDIGQVEIKPGAQKFIGLTQEELQRYADDPFWRRLRMALFILFWLSWILMFVVAIILVVTSPKCPPKPLRHWWQKNLCYQTYTRTFQDSNDDGVGDFNGMKSRIKQISRMHVQSIWPVPVLASTNFTGYDVTDFLAVDSRLGTLDEFKGLISEVHEKQMYMIMDMPLTTTSKEHPWFTEHPEYYKTSKIGGAGGQGLSWQSNGTGIFYLTFNNWPILNYDSDVVRDEMKEILRKWNYDRGVNGFYLGNVHLMSLNDDLTTDWARVADHLADLKTAVNDTSRQIALFTSLTNSTPEIVQKLLGTGGLDYIINTELVDVNNTCDTNCIHAKLAAALADRDINETLRNLIGHNETVPDWRMWEIGNPYKDRVTTRLDNNRQKSELMQMLLFMLGGSINAYYGDELGIKNVPNNKFQNPEKFAMRSPMQWDGKNHAGFSNFKGDLMIPVNDDYKQYNFEDAPPNSAKLFKKMAEWRINDESFLYGTMELAPSLNNTIGIQRNAYYKSPGYFAVLNFNNFTVQANLTRDLNFTVPAGTEQVTVGITTSNLGEKFKNRDPISIDDVELYAFSGLVIKYK